MLGFDFHIFMFMKISCFIVGCLCCLFSRAQWNLSYKDSAEIEFTDINVVNEDLVYVIGHDSLNQVSNVLKTMDDGVTWMLAGSIMGLYKSIFFLDDQLGFIGGEDGNILRTDDGGQNWSLVNSESTLEILDIHFSTDSIGHFIGMSHTVTTTNRGQSFQLGLLENPCGFAIESSNNNYYFMNNRYFTDCSSPTFGCGAETIFLDFSYFECTATSFHVSPEEMIVSGYGSFGQDYGYPQQEFGQLYYHSLIHFLHFPSTSRLNDFSFGGENMYLISEPYQSQDYMIKKEPGSNFYIQQLIEPGGVSIDYLYRIEMINDTLGLAIGQNAIYFTSNAGGPSIGDAPMSIQEIAKNKVRISPNPFSNEINIMSEMVVEDIKVFDSRGRIVFEQNAFGKELTLSLESLPQGIYILEITDSRGSQTYNIVKE